jgi:hypothetical protein
MTTNEPTRFGDGRTVAEKSTQQLKSLLRYWSHPRHPQQVAQEIRAELTRRSVPTDPTAIIQFTYQGTDTVTGGYPVLSPNLRMLWITVLQDSSDPLLSGQHVGYTVKHIQNLQTL